MTKLFKTIKIREETKEKLQTIAKMLGKSQAQVLSEYITELYGLMALFNGLVNITYDSSVLSESLTVQLFGASKMIVGSFPMPCETSNEECDAKIREKVVKEFEERQKENV